MVAKSPTKARLERTKKQIESMEDDLAKLSARLNVLRAREQLKQNRERYKMQLKQNAERKQRTHKLIVIGATLIHFFQNWSRWTNQKQENL